MNFTDTEKLASQKVINAAWLLSKSENSVKVNDRFWKCLGFKNMEEHRASKDLFDHVFPSDREPLKEVLDKNRVFKETNSRMLRFLHKSGEWIWFDLKIRDIDDGDFTRSILLFDIPSTEKQEQIFDHFDSINRVGGWYVDMSSMQLYWTPSMYRVHGMEEGIIPSVEEAINFYKEGDSRIRIAELFQQAVEEGLSFDGEFEFVDARGREKWVRSRGKPVMKDGKCSMVYGTIQDITLDKEKQFEIDETKRRFEQVFNSTYQFCGILDADGVMLEANDALTTFAGVEKWEVIGKKFWNTHWWSNSKRSQNKLKKAIQKAAQGKFVRYNEEVVDKDKNGVAIDFSLKPVKEEGGASLLIAEGRIIQELVEAQQSLEEMIRKTTQQNEVLRNFAHIVSHNLRSHAGNITLLTGIIEETQQVPDQNLKDMLVQASQRLTQTIEHVSEVVVVHTSENSEYDKINLLEEVKATSTTVSALIRTANATVKVDIPENLLVEGVPAYVESIFLNLFTNGIKYRSESRKCVLSIKAVKKKKVVEITFQDNGIGIDMETNGSKVFGMYKTFHGNEDARGIGLFITKNQIESMGGSIDVDSELGVGTTFTVKLLAG